jgi:hypothetical protein
MARGLPIEDAHQILHYLSTSVVLPPPRKLCTTMVAGCY